MITELAPRSFSEVGSSKISTVQNIEAKTTKKLR